MPTRIQSVALQEGERFCETCAGCLREYRELLRTFRGGPDYAEVPIERFDLERFTEPWRRRWVAALLRRLRRMWPRDGFPESTPVLSALASLRWDSPREPFRCGEGTYPSAHAAVVKILELAAIRWTSGVKRFVRDLPDVPPWRQAGEFAKLHTGMVAEHAEPALRIVQELEAGLILERATLTAALAEAGAGPEPTAGGHGDEAGQSDAPTEWWPAKLACRFANRIAGLERSGKFWRRFCEREAVSTRRPRTRAGTPNSRRLEIEVGSLARAIAGADELAKTATQREKHRAVVSDRLRHEHIDEVIKEAIRAAD